MATYDTLIDADGQEHQTKALGKGLRTYHPGDRVSPSRSPLTEAEYQEFKEGRWDASTAPVPLQVALGLDDTPLYAQIDAGSIYTGVTAERDHALPLLDHHGRLIS